MSLERIQHLKTIAADPAESEQIRNIVGALAQMEQDRYDALTTLLETAGVDPETVPLPELPDRDDRIRELCDVIKAKLSGDLWTDVWVPHLAPEAIEGPERAVGYAQMTDDEWEAQVEQWADRYRDADSFDAGDMTDREIADVHLRDQFQTPIAAFEMFVQAWTAADVLEQSVAGYMMQMDLAVDEVAARIENPDDSDGDGESEL